MGERVCSACGASGGGRFCSECGASLVDGPVHVRHVLRDEAAEVIGFDRRLTVTLRDLLLHPVRIVSVSMSGDRRRYLPPLKLFLALGGLYMLGLSIVQPYGFDVAGLQRSGLRPEAAARMEARIRESGISVELFTERFQTRMNAVTPLVTAVALLPMVAVLRALDRRRPWAEHLMFMLAASNGVWLVSLLVLPIYFANFWLHLFLAAAVPYTYLGVVFFPLYRARTAARTIARFALFVVVDFVLSIVLSGVLFGLVYGSVLLM